MFDDDTAVVKIIVQYRINSACVTGLWKMQIVHGRVAAVASGQKVPFVVCMHNECVSFSREGESRGLCPSDCRGATGKHDAPKY